MSIGFFAICSFTILHLFFSSFNHENRRAIFSYLLIYGGLISAWQIFRYINVSNYGISFGSAIGATLGLIAGFYFGYQVSILAGIFDGVSSIDSSSITLAISFGSGEAGRLIGSYLGNVLLPI